MLLDVAPQTGRLEVTDQFEGHGHVHLGRVRDPALDLVRLVRAHHGPVPLLLLLRVEDATRLVVSLLLEYLVAVYFRCTYPCVALAQTKYQKLFELILSAKLWETLVPLAFFYPRIIEYQTILTLRDNGLGLEQQCTASFFEFYHLNSQVSQDWARHGHQLCSQIVSFLDLIFLPTRLITPSCFLFPLGFP